VAKTGQSLGERDTAQNTLTHVSKGRMPQIVRQCNGLGEVFVEAKRPRYGARYLRYFERVSEARSRMVALGEKQNLRLVFETPE
jgi:hypothetical protein